MRVYTSKLTPDSVVTYLFHDCERSHCDCSASVARTCDDQSTVHLDWQLGGYYFCAFEGSTEFCFVFRFGFRASLLDFTSRIERLHFCYYYADVWSVLAYFCSEYSRARPSTGRSGQVIGSVCMRKPVLETDYNHSLFPHLKDLRRWLSCRRGSPLPRF